MRYSKRIFIILALQLLILCSCDEKTSESTTAPGTYLVYYLSNAQNDLTSFEYKTDETDPSHIMQELLIQMQRNDREFSSSVFEGDIRVLSFSLENQIATINLDKSYLKLNTVKEVLSRAAMTKTLCQVKGIIFVTWLVDGQPLTGSDGQPVGYMSEADFVSIVGRDINSVETAKLKLYFTNRDGTGLMVKTMEATYGSSYSIERFTIEQLIKGPDSEDTGMFPVLPPDLRVLSISTKDGVCYVNFTDAFLTKPLDVNEYIPVYAIVNSLTELPSIIKVQININGTTSNVFRDSISLENPFERNLDLVIEKEPPKV